MKTPIVQPLSGFPEVLGDWRRIASRQSSKGVVDMLGVDDYIDYSYQNSKGEQIHLYAAFYESVGTGGGYHSPKNCLPGGGWGIAEDGAVQLHSGGNTPDEVTRMVIRKKSEAQLVYYWYQNRGRIIASEYWEKIFLVLDALLKKRRDGSFVRIMMVAPEGDVSRIESTINDFSGEVVTELRNFLPGS
jgi:EpsI family protein